MSAVNPVYRNLRELVAQSEVAEDYEFPDELIDQLAEALYEFENQCAGDRIYRPLHKKAKKGQIEDTRKAASKLLDLLREDLSNPYTQEALVPAFAKCLEKVDKTALWIRHNKGAIDVYETHLELSSSQPELRLLDLEVLLTALTNATKEVNPIEHPNTPTFDVGAPPKHIRPLVRQLNAILEPWSKAGPEDPRSDIIRSLLELVGQNQSLKTIRNVLSESQ